MKQLLLLVSFLASTILAQAQAPGYQGKRFFVEIGASFFPNLGFPTAQNQGPQTFPFEKPSGHFTMKDYYSLSLHYTFSRKNNLKLGYNYQVSGLSTKITTPSVLYNSYYDYRDLFYQLHAHDVNLSLEIYAKRRGHLAPLGIYYALGLRFVFVESALLDQRIEYADRRSDKTPILNQLSVLPQNPTVFLLGLAGSLGYRTIIANRIVLNFALEATLFPQHFLLSAGFIRESSLNDYQRGVLLAIPDRYLFGIHIGVGALLF